MAKNIKVNIYNIIYCLFLTIFILILYWQVLSYDFIAYDDQLYVYKNPYVQSGLSFESVSWAFSSFHAGNWHPLTWLSHILDYEIFKLQPSAYHRTNVLIHIFNTLLLFGVLKMMTGALWQSFVVALVFAIHPLHVESVSWISERKDLLCGFFWFLSLWAYVRYVRSSGIRWYLFLMFLFILGLLSKPMIVTLPFTLLLLDLWPISRITNIDNKNKKEIFKAISLLIYEKAPLFLLSMVSCIITYVAQSHAGALVTFKSYPLSYRITNAIFSYLIYIAKFFWPKSLAVFYPYPTYNSFDLVIGFSILISITFILIYVLRNFPYLTFGWLWYLGTLVPVIGIIQVGSQSMADRYTYIPMVGLLIALTWGIEDILKRWQINYPVCRSISLIFLAAYFSIFSWIQAGYWKNSETLFKHAIEVTKSNSGAHFLLGSYYYEQGIFEEAMIEYKKAIKINPNNGNAHKNLGNIYAIRSDAKRAIFHYNAAIRVSQDPSEVYCNLAKIYTNQNKIKEAIQNYKKALEINPEMTMAMYQLAWIYVTHSNDNYRNDKEAIRISEKLCEINKFQDPLSLDVLAAAYANAGRYTEAAELAKKAYGLAEKCQIKDLSNSIKDRLELYKSGQPYRQPAKR